MIIGTTINVPFSCLGDRFLEMRSAASIPTYSQPCTPAVKHKVLPGFDPRMTVIGIPKVSAGRSAKLSIPDMRVPLWTLMPEIQKGLFLASTVSFSIERVLVSISSRIFHSKVWMPSPRGCQSFGVRYSGEWLSNNVALRTSTRCLSFLIESAYFSAFQ